MVVSDSEITEFLDELEEMETKVDLCKESINSLKDDKNLPIVEPPLPDPDLTCDGLAGDLGEF